jgi:hypothetical protein
MNITTHCKLVRIQDSTLRCGKLARCVHQENTRLLKSPFFCFNLSLLSFKAVGPMLDSPIMYRGGDSPLSTLYVN